MMITRCHDCKFYLFSEPNSIRLLVLPGQIHLGFLSSHASQWPNQSINYYLMCSASIKVMILPFSKIHQMEQIIPEIGAGSV